MKKIVLLSILLLISRIGAAEIMITVSPEAQEYCAAGQEAETYLHQALTPVHALVKHATRTEATHLTCDIRHTTWHKESFKKWDLKIKTKPECLVFDGTYMVIDELSRAQKPITRKLLYINSIEVKKPYQGQKIASTCLTAFTKNNLARSLGYTQVKLICSPDLRGFYKRLEFSCPHEEEEDRAMYTYGKEIETDEKK